MKNLILSISVLLLANVALAGDLHEGAYEIKVTCASQSKECASRAKVIQHMSIFDTLTEKGLSVNLADSFMSAPMFTFAKAELTNNGTHIRGVSKDVSPTTRVAKVDLDIELSTGKVTGLLVDADLGQMMIEGAAVRRISDFYSDDGPSRVVEVSEILGRYEGTLASGPATLTLSRDASGELSAVVGFTGLMLNYPTGTFDSEHGVLQLAGQGGNMGDRKLVLALRNNNEGQEMLSGFMLTATPQTPTAEFRKVSAK